MVNQVDWLFLGPELLSSGWPRLERLTTTLTTCTSTSTKGIRQILETNFGRNAENVKNMASPSYLLHMIISEQERPGTLGRVCRVKYRALYGAKNGIICACHSSVAVQFSWHCNMASIQCECCSITHSVSLGPSENPKKSRNIIIHWNLKPGDLNESSYSRSSLFSLNCKDRLKLRAFKSVKAIWHLIICAGSVFLGFPRILSKVGDACRRWQLVGNPLVSLSGTDDGWFLSSSSSCWSPHTVGHSPYHPLSPVPVSQVWMNGLMLWYTTIVPPFLLPARDDLKPREITGFWVSTHPPSICSGDSDAWEWNWKASPAMMCLVICHPQSFAPTFTEPGM